MEGIGQGSQTEATLRAEQVTYPVIANRLIIGMSQVTKIIQRPLVTQQKIPAEMVHKVILNPRQVVSYWSDTLLDEKLPQLDCLLAEHPGVCSSLFVHLIHYHSGIAGKYVKH